MIVAPEIAGTENPLLLIDATKDFFRIETTGFVLKRDVICIFAIFIALKWSDKLPSSTFSNGVKFSGDNYLDMERLVASSALH